MSSVRYRGSSLAARPWQADACPEQVAAFTEMTRRRYLINNCERTVPVSDKDGPQNEKPSCT